MNIYIKILLLPTIIFSFIFTACQSDEGISEKKNKNDTIKTLTDTAKRFTPHTFINSNCKLQNVIDSLKLKNKRLYLKITKSEYCMSICYDTIIIKEYPVVFSGDPIHDKLQAGDGCTPEGVFHIISKQYHDGWSRKILLDYPTAESWRKHNQAIIDRKIAESGIGDGIEIHGHPGNDESMIDRRINWTAGCISMKNKDIEELYEYVYNGTKVIINKY